MKAQFTLASARGITLLLTFFIVSFAFIPVETMAQSSTPPNAVCQNVNLLLLPNGTRTLNPGQIDGGSSAINGILSITASQTLFTCADVGSNSVVLTVTDSNLNVATCTATVGIIDNFPPTIITQDAIVYLDASGNGSITAAEVDGGISDACGIASISVSQTSFTCADLGVNPVDVIAIDVNGNADTGSAFVTVIDSLGPIASCQDIPVILDNNGFASIAGADIDAGSFGICAAIDTLIAIPNTFTTADVGANVVTLTVVDVNGSFSTCQATVTVTEQPGNTYCPSAGLCTYYEWIKAVGFGGTGNFSGNNGGYEDYTDVTFSANAGEWLNFQLRPGYSCYHYKEYWRVWIDYNDDGDYTDAGELVFQASKKNIVHGCVYIPSYVPTGTHNMRISMRFGCYANSCQTFAYGEVEDYTINILPSASSKDDPMDLAQMSVLTESDNIMAGLEITQISPSLITSGVESELYVEFRSAEELQQYSATITNVDGQIVHESDLGEARDGANTASVVFGSLAPGMYLINLHTADGIQHSQRFMVVD